MKCDETRPECGHCLKSGRACVYHATFQSKDSEEDSPSSEVMILTSIPKPHAARHDQFVHSENSCTLQQLSYSIHGPCDTPCTYYSDEVNAQAASRLVDLSSAHPTLTSPTTSLVALSPRDDNIIYTPDLASRRWFGLLAGDAGYRGRALDPSGELYIPPIIQHHQTSNANDETGTSPQPFHNPMRVIEDSQNNNLTQYVSPPSSRRIPGKEIWQTLEPILLLSHEIPIFKNFVNRLSHWIDLFDPNQHFSTLVPHLAMHNIGLMKALLALSARHISLNPPDSAHASLGRSVALQYYSETLQYLQKAMKHDTYTCSLELIATALTVSTYEMIDGSGSGWERHLKGVFWIQRSQEINGDTGGLKQAVWWAWLRQDVWAAFRERRRVFSFWKPTRPHDVLTPYELAARATYLLAQAVNYCSDEETKAGERDLQERVDRADTLVRMMEDWKRNLGVEFDPLPTVGISEGVFDPIWVHPPAFGKLNISISYAYQYMLLSISKGVSIQLHCCAQMLLALHRPRFGGLQNYFDQQELLCKNVNTICGLAMAFTDDSSSLVSSQCLFMAGMCVQEQHQREAILELIGACQSRTGWPIKPLREDLIAEWQGPDR